MRDSLEQSAVAVNWTQLTWNKRDRLRLAGRNEDVPAHQPECEPYYTGKNAGIQTSELTYFLQFPHVDLEDQSPLTTKNETKVACSQSQPLVDDGS